MGEIRNNLQDKQIIIGAVILVSIISYIGMFIYPKIVNIKESESKCRKLRQEINQGRLLSKQMRLLEQRYAKMTDYFGLIDFFKIEDYKNEIIEFIYENATRFDLKILKLNEKPLRKDRYTAVISGAVDLAGNWENIIKFIYALENSEVPFFISELFLEKSDENQKLLVKIVVSRLFIKEDYMD